MKHYGIICPPVSGHLYPMCGLGRALQRRGHRVTFFQFRGCEPRVEAAGLGFRPIGRDAYPEGWALREYRHDGILDGLAAAQYMKYMIDLARRLSEPVLSEGPEALRAEGIEAVLVDQASPGGESVAEHLGLPYVSVACAMIANWHESIPPHFTPWRFRRGWWARLRNRFAYAVFRRLSEPLFALDRDYRRRWGLPLASDRNARHSTLAQLSQQPTAFEFPRTDLPDCFRFVGPFSDPGARPPVAFPWERLTGQPLIYASLGTLHDRPAILRQICEACAEIDAQLVISLGGVVRRESLQGLPGTPIIVDYAPQLELVRRADLVITHAGMNTVLESLAHGVPMVAIPITDDQPGVSTRLIWSGAGERVLLHRLSARRIRAAILRVLTEPSYRGNARRIQAEIARSGGADRAAEIIDRVT